jgi:hypothetical protein
MPDTPKHTLLYLIKGFVIITIVMSLLGYIDYITGDISLDVFYILCLCLTTWYTSTFIGLLCVLEIMLAKTTADYFDHIKIGAHSYDGNTISYFLMYLVVCILVGLLKKALYK